MRTIKEIADSIRAALDNPPAQHTGMLGIGLRVEEARALVEALALPEGSQWQRFNGYSEAMKVYCGDGVGVGGVKFIFRTIPSGIEAMAVPACSPQARNIGDSNG